MADVSLYVNQITNETTKWTEVGVAPYLDTQNQPTSYIYTTGRNDTSDTYGFADSADLGTITSVLLYVYCQSVATSDFTAYVNATQYSINPGTTWAWKSVNVTATLSTWTLVNAATVYFQHANTGNRSDIDCAYLFVTYTPAAGPTNVKTFNGLAKASVKTVDNLAYNSIKSIIGLT